MSGRVGIAEVTRRDSTTALMEISGTVTSLSVYCDKIDVTTPGDADPRYVPGERHFHLSLNPWDADIELAAGDHIRMLGK